jgi:hypothetical protein
MLPLALICTGKVCTLGLPMLTVSAVLGALAFGVWAPAAPHNKDRLKQNVLMTQRDVAQGRRRMVGVMGVAPKAGRSSLSKKPF